MLENKNNTAGNLFRNNSFKKQSGGLHRHSIDMQTGL